MNQHESIENLSKQLQVTSSFNPDGSSSSLDERIIGGNHTGILILTDMKYGWVMDLLEMFRKNTWFPQTIDYTKDKLQYKTELTNHEFRAIRNILSFLIYLDSIQTVQPALYSMYITSPAISALMTYQAQQEMIHSWSYSHNLESIDSGTSKMEVFDLWKSNPLLMERNKFTSKYYDEFRINPTAETMTASMAANYLLESVFFNNGFKFFYSLEARGLMMGTASNIRYINRDEFGHQVMYKNVFNTLRSENQIDINNDMIIGMFEEGVRQEIEFSVDLLTDVLGFNDTVIDQYTKYRANKSLSDIGIAKNPFSEFTKNPFRKYDEEFEGTIMRETNVFSGKNINYIGGGGALGGFDRFSFLLAIPLIQSLVNNLNC